MTVRLVSMVLCLLACTALLASGVKFNAASAKPDGGVVVNDAPFTPVLAFDCAGQWTRAVCTINDPANGNQMIVPNAANAQDALRRGKLCRADVSGCSYFQEGVRLACAPYVLCNK